MHPTDPSLSLDSPWAMGEEGFTYVLAVLESAGAKVLLEFGSGVSSTRFALARPEMRVVTVDHEPRFLRKVESDAVANDVSDRIHRVHAPLTWRQRGLARYCTYDIDRVQGQLSSLDIGSVDAVFIDGPPSWTGAGRVGLVEELLDREFFGAAVAILDDASRGMERYAVEQLRERGPRDAVRLHDVGHGLGIINPKGATWGPNSRRTQAFLSARSAVALSKQGARRIVKGARHP